MKKLPIGLLTLKLFFLSQTTVFAQGSFDPDNNTKLSGVGDVLSRSDVDPLKGKFTDFGSIISAILPYLLTGAGLILFAMLIIGGFEIMTSTSDAKKADAGKQRITTAIIGFVIIFAAYWIAQILEILFGVTIL